MLLLYEFSRGNQVDGSPRVAVQTVSVVVFGCLPVGSAPGHSRYLGLVWLILPRNLGMSSVREEENLNPKRSPEINIYVRARGAPWMSGFWIEQVVEQKTATRGEPSTWFPRENS